jgi:alkylation response protein AidB-like acyl-CoA dehydrogenase
MQQSNKVFGYTRMMVGAMALGAGEAALEIAIPYAKKRIQFGSPLSEKQGYAHKLIVPNVVRLEAGTAYMEELALRLDSGEEDLQVEGSICKYFLTEAANKTGDDCIQALGGYGYVREYEVEKIKRDIKITCIYEGTSEIQQNIISTFRWKKTRKTKGAYYADMAADMHALADELGETAYGLYGQAAAALNEAIDLAHSHRLTRQQAVMFNLADMMTWVEVGVAMARKTAALVKDPKAKKAAVKRQVVMNRVFAREVARTVGTNAMNIVLGTGILDDTAVAAFKAKVSLDDLIYNQAGLLTDMDQAADIIFGR